METLKTHLTTHSAAYVLAALIGIVSIAPQLYFASQPEFRGVQMFGADAEPHYLARVEEVYDGHPGLGNVFLSEKDQPYVIPGLGEVIMAAMGKLTGLSAAGIGVAVKFIFPFLIALLFYFFCLRLFSSREAALLGSAFAQLGYNLMSGFSAWTALLHAQTPIVGFLTYSRPVNPEITTLFLFGALLLLLRDWERERPRWGTALAVGALAGLSLYISPFPWAFLNVCLGLLFLYALLRQAYAWAGHFLAAVAVSAALTAPFLYNYFISERLASFADTMMRVGLVQNHSFVLSWWLIVLLALTLFCWPRRFYAARPFLCVAVAALWIVTEQQVITGQFLQAQHFHWYIVKPLIGFVAAAYGIYLLERFVKNRMLVNAVLVLGIVFLFYNASVVQLRSYRANLPQALAEQSYAPVLQYVAQHYPVEQTVWAPEGLSNAIPVYTRHNAANNHWTGLYFLPQRYMEERLMLNYRLMGVKPADILARLKADRGDVSSKLYLIYWREKTGAYAGIPDAILERIAGEYPAFYAKPYGKAFKDLGITLVVWDKIAEPDAPYAKLSFLKPVAEFPGFTLYEPHY